jgi:hypothetical protein
LAALQPLMSRAQDAGVEVIVVNGRQPSPPLWRVTNGDNTLWILPLLSAVPSDLRWEDWQVKNILEQSQQLISPPGANAEISMLALSNPINWVRLYRLVKRLRRESDGGLQAALPADVYARYLAVKERYFPKEDDYDELRPGLVALMMVPNAMKHEDLEDSGEIIDHVRALARRQRQLQRTDVSVEQKIEGGFKSFLASMEAWYGTLSNEAAINCFTWQLELLETKLDDMREVATAWAAGSPYGLVDFRAIGSLEDPCVPMISTLLSTSVGELAENLTLTSNERWLDAASAALQNNHSTFTMLPLNEISGDASLVAALAARGYSVHDPADLDPEK